MRSQIQSLRKISIFSSILRREISSEGITTYSAHLWEFKSSGMGQGNQVVAWLVLEVNVWVLSLDKWFSIFRSQIIPPLSHLACTLLRVIMNMYKKALDK